MSDIWHVVIDDALTLADKTAEFLMGEFCLPVDDPMWSAEYFRWKLSPMNPAGAGYLTLAMIGDRVVGTVSLTRKRLLIDGNYCIGGEVGDSYTSVGMRKRARPLDLSSYDDNPNSYINKSMFGRLASETRMRAELDGVSLIYGTPNSNAYPGWTKRLGYFDSQACAMRSFVHPTAKMVTSIHPRTQPLRGALRVLEAASVVVSRGIYKAWGGRHFTFERQLPTSSDLDDLWARVKPDKGFALVRDAAYWRHRYIAHPLATYDIFAIREHSRLCGLVVTRILSAGGGKRHLAIVEWMNEKHVSFGRVATEILHHFRNHEIEAFQSYASPSSAEATAFVRSLFVPRSRVPIIFADNPVARSLESNRGGFEFYLGSTDAI